MFGRVMGDCPRRGRRGSDPEEDRRHQMRTPKPFYKRHEDDEWIDEIRVKVVPRYKTSGLSGKEWRAFCRKHLRRGDAGLDDADDNYEVVSGPGPDEAQGWEQDESPSIFGGTITVTPKTSE